MMCSQPCIRANLPCSKRTCAPSLSSTHSLARPDPTQRACKKLGLGCVAVFTEPDALSLHVLGAPESVCLGASPKEYLNADRLIEVAKETGERTCWHAA